ncbi:MAG: hypothetical protein AUJ51_00845 [Elusimicrobia bacterium CG1_02_56_21]|nr:MAG: hypothetical protein AUJ51_00845 [Elusimicrobia bacterium CG1_02_56_21]
MDQQTEKPAKCRPEKEKMDALARLSSKVAHDLNNVLGAIEGYATLAMGPLRAEDPLKQDLQEIRTAVAKAAGFNRQLLVFSGRQMLNRKPTSVNEIIGELLKKEAGSPAVNIKFEASLQPDLPGIIADQDYLSQAISALLANARAAMPEGGTVAVVSSLLRIEGKEAGSPKPEEAGTEFIKISIKDTGVGISAADLEHLFEPAYLTQGRKRGAGLGGLAMVYGVVKQHNGWVEAISAPGRGSEFLVFIPAANGKAA